MERYQVRATPNATIVHDFRNKAEATEKARDLSSGGNVAVVLDTKYKGQYGGGIVRVSFSNGEEITR